MTPVPFFDSLTLRRSRAPIRLSWLVCFAPVNPRTLRNFRVQTIDNRTDSRTIFIDATPAQVFAAISDPARVTRWWGPDGFKSTIHQFDFRPGGVWLLTMHGPDGKDYANESRFTHIVSSKLVEIEHLSGHHFILSIEMKPVALGTQVHWRQTFDTVEHYKPIAHFIAIANEQNLQRLAAEVLHVTR